MVDASYVWFRFGTQAALLILLFAFAAAPANVETSFSLTLTFFFLSPAPLWFESVELLCMRRRWTVVTASCSLDDLLYVENLNVPERWRKNVIVCNHINRMQHITTYCRIDDSGSLWTFFGFCRKRIITMHSIQRTWIRIQIQIYALCVCSCYKCMNIIIFINNFVHV